MERSRNDARGRSPLLAKPGVWRNATLTTVASGWPTEREPRHEGRRELKRDVATASVRPDKAEAEVAIEDHALIGSRRCRNRRQCSSSQYEGRHSNPCDNSAGRVRLQL